MGRTYKVGPAGSYGARYGTVARKRYSTVVTALRAPHECPQCHISAVTRLSVGIWFCGRCGFKFAGGAYLPTTKLGQIAERAARAGAVTLAAEKAQAAKPPAKRRRRKAEGKEGADKGAEKSAEEKSA